MLGGRLGLVSGKTACLDPRTHVLWMEEKVLSDQQLPYPRQLLKNRSCFLFLLHGIHIEIKREGFVVCLFFS